jgi:hypothetical protein
VAGALEISLSMLTAGGAESLGPTQAKQMFLTGFFRVKLFLKLKPLQKGKFLGVSFAGETPVKGSPGQFAGH